MNKSDAKSGDKVRCIIMPNNNGKWTVGKIYEVGGNPSYPESIVDDVNAGSWSRASSAFQKDSSEAFYSCFELVPKEYIKDGLKEKEGSDFEKSTKHKCNCVFRDLMMNGCRCGGV